MKTERQDCRGEFSFVQETDTHIDYEMWIELPQLPNAINYRYIPLRLSWDKERQRADLSWYYDSHSCYAEEDVNYKLFSEITGHKAKQNVAFDCCASLDTHKGFDKLTVSELVEAMRKRLDDIEKENNLEAFGLVDSYDHD